MARLRAILDHQATVLCCTPTYALRLAEVAAAEGVSLAGQPVKLRFHLRQGSLYAFWVSTESSGASHGFVAAGGPGFTGPMDTNQT